MPPSSKRQSTPSIDHKSHYPVTLGRRQSLTYPFIVGASPEEVEGSGRGSAAYAP